MTQAEDSLQVLYQTHMYFIETKYLFLKTTQYQIILSSDKDSYRITKYLKLEGTRKDH